jgi:periplasmic divalent cation tolerance protein
MKTRAALYPELEKKIKEVHPYEVPEIIALPVQRGSADYLNWIDKETKS